MSRENKKILIVDDSGMDVEVMTRHLREAGFKNIFSVQTGEECLEKIKTDPPQIIILDTLLPGIDGFEVCRRIKACSGPAIKIIMLTGVISAIDTKKARQSGTDEYVVKTPEYGFLLGVLELLIENGK